MRYVVEVDGGAGKHPYPQSQDAIEGDVEQVEGQVQVGRTPAAGAFQLDHGGHFFCDHQRGVGQDEGVTGDVVAAPGEAGPPAVGLAGELGAQALQGSGLVAGACGVLDVEEGVRAGVPHAGGHHERAQPLQREHQASDARVGQGDEREEEEEGPSP